MGISVFPTPSAGGIKTVQRGSAAGSGNVTITSVNIAKSFVTVYGTASSGTVSASFGLSTNQNNTQNFISHPWPRISTTSGFNDGVFYGNNGGNSLGISQGTMTAATNSDNSSLYRILGSNVNGTSTVSHTVNAGSNNLVAAVVQGFLANATTLTVSGACRWEVVEFN